MRCPGVAVDLRRSPVGQPRYAAASAPPLRRPVLAHLGLKLGIALGCRRMRAARVGATVVHAKRADWLPDEGKSPMTNAIDKTLIDQAIGAYIEWREACFAVQDAYDRWARARSADNVLAFLDYAIALDRRKRRRARTPGRAFASPPSVRPKQRATAAGEQYARAAR